MLEWVFDALPPSGARRGGDPAEHAFKHDLDTFVREVVQNANDQRIGELPPEVHFRLHELEGDALAAFRERLAWPTLAPHLEAAAQTRGGRALRRYLDELAKSGRMLLLAVEDRHTVGLTGEETDDESHFRALCKDTLYSHKRHSGAGGSYGLGKSVLWSFSGLSTVLFNSVLYETPKKRRSPRLIGRVELPSHRARDDWFAGSGWFGERVEAEGGARAESIWSLEAALEARELYLGREERATGTSILLVGFRDPTADDEPSVAELSRRMRGAAVHWFWPAMEMKAPGLRITVDGAGAAPNDESVRPFVEAWRARRSPRAELEQPGDVVARAIPIRLPPSRAGDPAVEGEVRLVVRLAAERGRDPLNGHVATFRRPGMVVRYWDRSGLALGMRPFHAVLAAGEARDPENVTDADRAIERFLRAAEPPGHDVWHATPALKEGWQRGYAKALSELEQRVGAALRELLTPRPSHGSRGPEALMKRFPIGKGGASEGEPSAFRFSSLDASFDGERWSFSATVEPSRRAHGAWETTVALVELGDGGVRLDALPIAQLETPTAGARASVEDGVARIAADASLDRVALRGVSAPVASDAEPGELLVEVGGRLAAGAP